MSKTNFVTIGKVLESSTGSLAKLTRGAERILKYDGLLRQTLSAPLVEHVTVANVDGDRLVVHADSPAWSARLRYQLPELEAALAEHGIRVISVATRPQRAEKKN